MPPQKKMNRTGGGRQAKKEKGEESGDGTRDGSKLVYSVQTPIETRPWIQRYKMES